MDADLNHEKRSWPRIYRPQKAHTLYCQSRGGKPCDCWYRHHPITMKRTAAGRFLRRQL